MNAFPLIERELRVTLRKTNPNRERLIFGGMAVGITALILLLMSGFGSRSGGAQLLSFLIFLGVMNSIAIPSLLAGSIAEERRNQTLGILFLTGLRPWEVFLSKFTGAVIVALSRILIIYPIMAIPFFMGGCQL